MTQDRQLNTATYPMHLPLVDTAGAPVSGVTPTVTIRKSGGVFAAAAAVPGASDASGVFALPGNATDRNTLGAITYAVSGTGAISYTVTARVVSFDPFAYPTLASPATANGNELLHQAGTPGPVSPQTLSTGTDNRVLVSADAHTSGQTIASVSAAGVTTIATGVWNALTTGLTTVGSVGKRLVDFVTTLVYAAPPTPADIWANATRTLTAGTNIALAKGTGITGFNDIAAADVWAVATRTLTAGTNIVLAKGTGITGFNDITATNVWDALMSGMITVGSVGKRVADNLDVAVSTRMATFIYTAPLDAAGVRSAVGLAAANLDVQLTDIPTVAEFNARSLLAADYATASVLGTVNTAVGEIKAVTAKLDTALVQDLLVWQFTANALELAPAGGGGGGGTIVIEGSSIEID